MPVARRRRGELTLLTWSSWSELQWQHAYIHIIKTYIHSRHACIHTLKTYIYTRHAYTHQQMRIYARTPVRPGECTHEHDAYTSARTLVVGQTECVIKFTVAYRPTHTHIHTHTYTHTYTYTYTYTHEQNN